MNFQVKIYMEYKNRNMVQAAWVGGPKPVPFDPPLVTEALYETRMFHETCFENDQADQSPK